MPTTSIHSDRTQREREDALLVAVRLLLLLNTEYPTGVPSAMGNAQFSLPLLSLVVVLTFATSCMSSIMICLAWITAALRNTFIALVCLSCLTGMSFADRLQVALLVSETRV